MPHTQQLTLGQSGLDRHEIIETAYNQLDTQDKEVINRTARALSTNQKLRNFGAVAAIDFLASLGLFLAQQNPKAVDMLTRDMQEGRDVFEQWR